jgi:hypothetical protein
MEAPKDVQAVLTRDSITLESFGTMILDEFKNDIDWEFPTIRATWMMSQLTKDGGDWHDLLPRIRQMKEELIQST